MEENRVAWQNKSEYDADASVVTASATDALGEGEEECSSEEQQQQQQRWDSAPISSKSALVAEYIDTLPRDSFTVNAMKDWCTTIAKEDGSQYQAQIQLLAPCAVRRRFKSAWCDSPGEAQTDVSMQALDFLKGRGGLIDRHLQADFSLLARCSLG